MIVFSGVDKRFGPKQVKRYTFFHLLWTTICDSVLGFKAQGIVQGGIDNSLRAKGIPNQFYIFLIFIFSTFTTINLLLATFSNSNDIFVVVLNREQDINQFGFLYLLQLIRKLPLQSNLNVAPQIITFLVIVCRLVLLSNLFMCLRYRCKRAKSKSINDGYRVLPNKSHKSLFYLWFRMF